MNCRRHKLLTIPCKKANSPREDTENKTLFSGELHLHYGTDETVSSRVHRGQAGCLGDYGPVTHLPGYIPSDDEDGLPKVD